MQITSKAYKTEQKRNLRNELYVNVYLGVISREAQANAVANGDFAIYSDSESVFSNPNFEAYYATCEDNQAKTDGSMFFMPRSKVFALYQGLVTEGMAGSVTFDFGRYKHLNIRGLTIDFGDYYPTEFTITNGSLKYTYKYTNNKKGVWSTDDLFLDSSLIRISADTMVGGNQRLRVLSIMFGVGLSFDNTNLISTSWDSEVAHLSDTLPVKTFSFTVDNTNRMFSADNPKAYTAYLEEQQEVRFDYGRKMDDDSVYWIPGGILNLKSWSSNDTQAKFNAVGYLDYSTGTYNKGQFYPDGISLYDLAVDVCEDAGYPSYKIDTYLKKLYTHNPLPIEKHKNLLQLIANAAMGILFESRQGEITIETSFQPDLVNVTSTSKTSYSTIDKVVKEDAFVEYADVEDNFVATDGHQYFLPRNETQLTTGYVSQKMSNEDGMFYKDSDNHMSFKHSGGTIIDGVRFEDIEYGQFVSGNYKVDFTEKSTDNPTLSVEWETAWTFFNMQLNFSDVHPEALVIHCFREGTETENFAVEDCDFNTPVQHDFYDVDKITFEFVKTNPNQRIHLGKIIFGNSVDYTLDYRDMTTTPVAKRTEFVRNIGVVYTRFGYGTQVKEISTVDVVSGSNFVVFNKANHNYSIAYEELRDDTEGYTKAKKVYVDHLPPIESAELNTYYFVYLDMSVVEIVNDERVWFTTRVTEQIVDNLPSTLQYGVVYLVRTDTNLIYHLYVKSHEDNETVSLGYRVDGTLAIIDSSAYTLTFTTNVESPVVISGIEFIVSEKTYTIPLNDVGADKTANNVLIDTLEHAQRESLWLKDYYSNDVEYTIKYRGEPSLEPDDLIYIENKFVEKNLIRIVDSTIDTDTGMSRSCTLHGRRISYTEG